MSDGWQIRWCLKEGYAVGMHSREQAFLEKNIGPGVAAN
jgi:hypothetical protein